MDKNDLAHVVRLLNSDQSTEAVAATRHLKNANPADMMVLAYHGAALRRFGINDEAMEILREVLDRSNGGLDSVARAVAHFEIGSYYIQLKDWQNCAHHFEKVAALQEPSSDLTGKLCMAYAMLGRWDESKTWGAKTISIKDREGQCELSEVLPRKRPKQFDPTSTKRNIVAYSLFGPDPYYHECAITTARTTPAVFPEFTCRFSCSPDIPKSVLKKLEASGAQIVIARQNQADLTPKTWGLFWRFLAFDDPGVDVVLVRDVDCPPIPRERAAIDLWLQSDAPFYALRDHVVHAEPLHAGLWGGFTGLLPELKTLIAGFVDEKTDRFGDQTFLRMIVWPRIREATLCIDSNYRIGHTIDYSSFTPKFARVHVGMSWTKERIMGK